MPAAHAGLLKDVLQVDLNGTWPDAEFLGDLAILEALFDKFHDLMLARRQSVRICVSGTEGFAENRVLHPASPVHDGAQASKTVWPSADLRTIPLAPACRNRSASASVMDMPQMTTAGLDGPAPWAGICS